MSEPVFHIGLHKTGTTALQRFVFPKWPGINPIYTDTLAQKFLRDLQIKDPMFLGVHEWRERISKILCHDRVNVFSHEGLSGSLYAGAVRRELDHRTPILENIKTVFSRAKILLVIRRQDNLARSIYRQYLKVGGTETIASFYGTLKGRSAVFPLDRFDFLTYVRKVNELFPGKVKVLPYELFAQHPERFLSEIATYLEVEAPPIAERRANESRFTPFGMEVSRILNFAFRSRFNRTGLIPGLPKIRRGKIQWVEASSILHNKMPGIRSSEKDDDSRIARICNQIWFRNVDSNRALCSEYSLGLEEFAYY